MPLATHSWIYAVYFSLGLQKRASHSRDELPITEMGSPPRDGLASSEMGSHSKDGIPIPKMGSPFQRWAPHPKDGVFIPEMAFSRAGMNRVSSQRTRVPELLDLELLEQLHLLE